MAQSSSLPFREGEPIRRGQPDRPARRCPTRRRCRPREALRAQSQATYERVKSVVDKGAGAPQDLDDAAAALKVAEANLSVARTALAKTRIVAPFDGVAGARRVSPGAFVRAGEPITDLAQITEIRVNFSAPERYLGKLARGARSPSRRPPIRVRNSRARSTWSSRCSTRRRAARGSSPAWPTRRTVPSRHVGERHRRPERAR